MNVRPILIALSAVALGAFSTARTQQPAPPIPPPTATPVTDAKTDAPTATVAEPDAWPGTFAEGFEEIKKFAEKQQLESAQKVADALLAPNSFLRWKLGVVERGGWRATAVGAFDPLLDAAGWNGLDPDARAEVWYAKGVVATLAKDRETAEADLWKARGMTSDPTLQRDTIYDLGSLALQAGEEQRAKLPEISGKQAMPPIAQPPAANAPGAPGGAQPPDPLQLAREAYLQARDRFVECLRDQWQDADCQADVELCLKRLRELDDIEKKRKEDEQKKKDEQQKKDQKDKQDQQDKKDDQKDQSGKDDKKKEPEKPKDEDKKKPEDKKPEQPKDEKDKDADKDKKKDAKPTEKQDGEMSPEEMTQLLDRLQRIEDEHKKIEAQLRAMRRAKVKKDW